MEKRSCISLDDGKTQKNYLRQWNIDRLCKLWHHFVHARSDISSECCWISGRAECTENTEIGWHGVSESRSVSDENRLNLPPFQWKQKWTNFCQRWRQTSQWKNYESCTVHTDGSLLMFAPVVLCASNRFVMRFFAHLAMMLRLREMWIVTRKFFSRTTIKFEA